MPLRLLLVRVALLLELTVALRVPTLLVRTHHVVHHPHHHHGHQPLSPSRLDRVVLSRRLDRVTTTTTTTTMAASPEVGGGGGAATKWPAYVRMCRPGNLPASLLFVVGGAMAATHDLRSAVRWPVLCACM